MHGSLLITEWHHKERQRAGNLLTDPGLGHLQRTRHRDGELRSMRDLQPSARLSFC